MSKTSFIDLAPESEDLFYKAIQSGDRFTNSRLRKKNAFLSRKSKKALNDKSLLLSISSAWATLSAAEKLDWKNAGAECNLSGWRLFMRDFAARQAEGLPGIATPSLLHQGFVGQIHLTESANELQICQEHPQNYLVYQKVVGKKSMFNAIPVSEPIELPFTLGLNYKAELSVSGPNPYAKFYARFWYSFEGQNLYHDLEINLDLISNWKNDSAVLALFNSYVYRYDLFFHFHDLQGDLYFDNIVAEHDSVNWARDQFCENIEQTFKGAFKNIPDNWTPIIQPDGAEYASIYKDF
jgi:hypothetical protein